MKLPKHYAKPCGVSSFRPTIKKTVCPGCGRMFPENMAHIRGDDFRKTPIEYCSVRCTLKGKPSIYRD